MIDFTKEEIVMLIDLVEGGMIFEYRENYIHDLKIILNKLKNR